MLSQPIDISEYLPILLRVGRMVNHITECGTRTGVSTTALVYARPQKLVCYDFFRQPQIDWIELAARKSGVAFVFHAQDILTADIEPTDLLFTPHPPNLLCTLSRKEESQNIL